MKITINARPITLNHCYKYMVAGRFVKSYHSEKYKGLRKIVDSEILKYKREIKDFFSSYDENKHFLICDWVFYYPIMTKPKKDITRVSKTSMDLSNIVKPIEDLIFKHLPVDDSQVLTLTSRKIDSDENKIEVTFSINSF